MGDFFHGWRRKTGIVALAMACLLALGWVRSVTLYDFFSVSVAGTTYRVGSMGGTLRLIWMTPAVRWDSFWCSGDLTDILQFNVDSNGQREEHDEWEGYDVDWRWDFAGCHFGGGSHLKLGENHCAVYALPYPMLVIVLTLVSARLIVHKKRRTSLCPASQQTALL
jgi:hypothetical protein